MSRFKNFVLKYLNVWTALIVGGVLGMCLFTLLVQAPQGLENWLSAIGTILAVVVSLYLANRPIKRGKIEINEVKITLHEFIKGNGQEAKYKLDVAFDCKNVGGSDVLIRDIDVIMSSQQIKVFSLDKIIDNYLIKEGEVKVLHPTMTWMRQKPNFWESYTINTSHEERVHEFKDDKIKLTLVDGEEISVPITIVKTETHSDHLLNF